MFDARYEVIVADTPGTLQIHHEIRYLVYCLEKGFENPDTFPDGQESDHWDANATAFIVRERETGQWLGAMRLVHPVRGGLPVHRLTHVNRDGAPARTGAAAELSRICVTQDYVRRQTAGLALSEGPGWGIRGGDGSGATSVGWRNQQRGPLFRTRLADDGECLNRQGMNAMVRPAVVVESRACSLTLPMRSELFAVMLRAAIEYSRNQDIPYMYFLVNRALARMVRRLGFEFSLAGVPCEYRGTRYPYLAHLDTAVQRATQSSPDMARLFLHGGEPYLLASTSSRHCPKWQ
ncbi:GNAT family N-acyltransferase [Ectothiorhodospira lacustris]|uniref:GNAT family N-acyltransferase n=1 Tax=Ectothiorhodospira lacustris TaxID=2899127 RepID=UPI001EE7C6D3|nr:GNAT family N-acyltransferase [Ectothiorhodospira lacustris]MCG5502075.1 GNAT family N-acetyltransferase [Ectothiorhodospira lacustris]